MEARQTQNTARQQVDGAAQQFEGPTYRLDSLSTNLASAHLQITHLHTVEHQPPLADYPGLRVLDAAL